MHLTESENCKMQLIGESIGIISQGICVKTTKNIHETLASVLVLSMLGYTPLTLIN